MRILTWNVNGIKTLLQYHPWNELKTYEGIMNALEADIICIQETKITRAQMTPSLALLPSFDAFYSFYRRNPPKGIHGTAIFTKRSTVIPLKAEEGLSSSLVPTTVVGKDRIGSYPSCVDSDLEYGVMKDLDSEGRCTVCDFGMFVLINLYCPALSNAERIPFKNNFNKMVDQRARELIKAGRQVIVLGDINIAKEAIDSAEPMVRAEKEEAESFVQTAPRRWLDEFTSPSGPMIDICRQLHKDRANMYTCWETKIDARTSNYGARIDYILITPGLLPWVKDSDILPKVVGSDHCPVYLDFHDELEIEGRGLVKLWDLLNPTRQQGDNDMLPPAFAARFYDEFSGKQKVLSNYFVKKDPSSSSVASSSKSVAPTPPVSVSSKEVSTSNSITSTLTTIVPSRPIPKASTSSLAPRSSLFADYVPTSSIPIESSTKGKGKGKGKEKELVEGQKGISSFFKPPPSTIKPKLVKKTKSTTIASSTSISKGKHSPSLPLPSSSTITIDDDSEDDFMGGMELDDYEATMTTNNQSSAESCPSSAIPSTSNSTEIGESSNSTSAWSNLFTPKAIPNCFDHDEVATLWTVKKPGINKGRRFYLCSRPVGAGYDQGQKGPINPLYRCNFFEWETNVKRPASLTPGGTSKKKSKK